MRTKSIKLIALSFLMMLTLVGCGNKSVAEASKVEQRRIKLGHVEPESRSTHRALLDFKKNVEERTNNEIIIDIFPNGALGGDFQLTESVAMGTLDSAMPASSVLTTYSDEFGILDMPYLFKDSQSAFDAMDGEVGDYLSKKLKENNIHVLGYTYNGPRSTTNNNGSIESPEDLKGVKMRVMESPIFIDFYKTLGANPTPMSFTELYTGLQQGTVHAQENPPSLTLANKFFEVQEYSTIDEHVHNFLAFIINEDLYNSLSDEHRKIIDEEAKKCVDEQRKLEIEDNEEAIEKLEKEGGLKTNRLSIEQKQEFRDKLQPMYDKYEKQFGKDLFEKCEQYN